MQSFEIETLPKVRFAHVYSVASYAHPLPPTKDCIEISLISEGEICRIGEDGSETVARKGDIIFIPYDVPCAVRADAFHEHRTVCATVKWRALSEDAGGLSIPPVTPSHLVSKTAQQIIDRLIRNQLYWKESPIKGASMFLSLLCELDRCNRGERAGKLPSEVLYTRRAKEYIHAHLYEPITQGAVARWLSISPEYLCAVFRKTEGTTLMRYCNEAKLGAIRELMEIKHLRLYEAAALLGYSDPNYVSRLFKKYYGYNITDKPHKVK